MVGAFSMNNFNRQYLPAISSVYDKFHLTYPDLGLRLSRQVEGDEHNGSIDQFSVHNA